MKWNIKKLFVKEPSPDQFSVDDHAVSCHMRGKAGAESISSQYEDDGFLIQTALKMKPVNDFLESEEYALYEIDIGGGTDELTHTGDVAYTYRYGAREGFSSFYQNGASDYRKTLEEKSEEYGSWMSCLNYSRISFDYRGKTEDISLIFSCDGVSFHCSCERIVWDEVNYKLKHLVLSEFDMGFRMRAEKAANKIGHLLYGGNPLITPA